MALRPWLYRVAHNAALNVARDPQARVGAAAREPRRRRAPGRGRFSERERLRRVVGAVAALPSKQREVIVRHALDGDSHERIATDLGMSAGSVRQLAHRARRTVRDAAAAAARAPPTAAAAAVGRGCRRARLERRWRRRSPRSRSPSSWPAPPAAARWARSAATHEPRPAVSVRADAAGPRADRARPRRPRLARAVGPAPVARSGVGPSRSRLAGARRPERRPRESTEVRLIRRRSSGSGSSGSGSSGSGSSGSGSSGSGSSGSGSSGSGSSGARDVVGQLGPRGAARPVRLVGVARPGAARPGVARPGVTRPGSGSSGSGRPGRLAVSSAPTWSASSSERLRSAAPETPARLTRDQVHHPHRPGALVAATKASSSPARASLGGVHDRVVEHHARPVRPSRSRRRSASPSSRPAQPRAVAVGEPVDADRQLAQAGHAERLGARLARERREAQLGEAAAGVGACSGSTAA